MSLPHGHPEKRLVYSSQSIHERRRRILRETRRMIAEGGLEGFSIRELCRRAEVAPRTLYNAFHSKDRVIALSIRETYDDFARHVAYSTEEASLEGVIDRAIATNRRNLDIRNYTRAVMAIYFAPTTPRDIWATIHDIAADSIRLWLAGLPKSQFQPWVRADELVDTLVRLRYATINSWCQGHISDADFLRVLIGNLLSQIVGAMRGNERRKAQEMLETMHKGGQLPRFSTSSAPPPGSQPQTAHA